MRNRLEDAIYDLLQIGNSNKGYAIPNATDYDLGGKEFNFRVGNSGNVVVDYKDGGKNISLVNCGDGSYHPNPVIKIHATGTTATDIVIFKIEN